MPPQRRARFVNLALWRTALTAVGALRALPFDARRSLCGTLGLAAYAAVPRIYRVIHANLAEAYAPPLGPKQRHSIARASARHMGHAMAELLHLPTLDRAFLDERITVEGFEGVDFSQPVVYVAAHLGAWEWMGAAVSLLGSKVSLVVRPFADPAMDRFVDSCRRSQGVETLEKYGAGAGVVRALRDGRSAGIMADQSPRQNAVPVTFFGRPCWATAGPVLAARRTQVPLVPLMLVRLPQGRYLLRRYPPVPVDATSPLREELAAASQRIQDVLESMVREFPGQWMWAHRRWKRRPELEAAWKDYLPR